MQFQAHLRQLDEEDKDQDGGFVYVLVAGPLRAGPTVRLFEHLGEIAGRRHRPSTAKKSPKVIAFLHEKVSEVAM
eukprot:14975670-Alexandrium_andersonii.AAC.1